MPVDCKIQINPAKLEEVLKKLAALQDLFCAPFQTDGYFIPWLKEGDGKSFSAELFAFDQELRVLFQKNDAQDKYIEAVNGEQPHQPDGSYKWERFRGLKEKDVELFRQFFNRYPQIFQLFEKRIDDPVFANANKAYAEFTAKLVKIQVEMTKKKLENESKAQDSKVDLVKLNAELSLAHTAPQRVAPFEQVKVTLMLKDQKPAEISETAYSAATRKLGLFTASNEDDRVRRKPCTIKEINDMVAQLKVS